MGIYELFNMFIEEIYRREITMYQKSFFLNDIKTIYYNINRKKKKNVLSP